MSYAYDADNLLTQLTDPTNKQTSYNDDNSRTSVTFPNGVTESMSYDRAERLTRIRATKGTAVLTDFEYSFAKGTGESDLRQQLIDRVRNTTTSYAYDHLGRLAARRRPAPPQRPTPTATTKTQTASRPQTKAASRPEATPTTRQTSSAGSTRAARPTAVRARRPAPPPTPTTQTATR